MNIPARIALGAAAVGIGGAIGYAAGAANNDPTEPDSNLVDMTGPAGIVMGFAGLVGGVSGEIPKFGAATLGLAGVSLLAGSIVGEMRDGQPY